MVSTAIAGSSLVILGLAGILLEGTFHNIQGDSLTKESRYEEAAQEYRKAGSDNLTTQLPHTYFLLGNYELVQKNFLPALTAYQKVLEKEFYPNSYTELARKQIGETYLGQGATFESTSDWTNAIKSYEQALAYPVEETRPQLNEKLSRVYLGQASSRESVKEWQGAIDSYHSALSYASGNTQNGPGKEAKGRIGAVYLEWGRALEKEGKPALEVLAKFDEVIKDANNPPAVGEAKSHARTILFRLGDGELAAARFERAITAYRRTLDQYGGTEAELRPYLSKTYLAWGQKLNQGNEFEEALEVLEPPLKTLVSEAEKPIYYAAIVDSYSGLGQKDLGEKKYTSVVERLTPAFKLYYTADSANQLQNTIIEALSAQATGFEVQKDYPKAIDEYNLATTFLLNNPDAENKLNAALWQVYFAQGTDFEQTRFFAKALTSYQSALGYATAAADADVQNILRERLDKLRANISYQQELKINIELGKEADGKQDYLKATDYYEQALSYASNAGEIQTITELRVSLVKLYTTLGQGYLDGQIYPVATTYFEKGLANAEALGDENSQAEINAKLLGINQAELENQEQEEEDIQNQEQAASDEVKGAIIEAGIVGCSFAPGVGIGCDITSIAISLKDGDWLGAGLSTVAIVPIVGDALGGGGKAAKIATKLVSLQAKLSKIGKLIEEVRLIKVATKEKLVKALYKTKLIKWRGPVSYTNLVDPAGVEAGKEFTEAQKKLIIQENKKRNGGVVLSDKSGKVLVPASKNQKGVTPSDDEWQIDHIQPKSKGGANSYSNAQVLSRQENLEKSNK